PVMTNGMNDLPRELTPDGSSLNSMQNQVSGAVGIALLISVMQGYVNFKLRTIDYVTPEIENEIMIQGINLAFNVGAVFMWIGVINAFFLRRVSSGDMLDSKSFSARPVGEARKINRKEDSSSLRLFFIVQQFFLQFQRLFLKLSPYHRLI